MAGVSRQSFVEVISSVFVILLLLCSTAATSQATENERENTRKFLDLFLDALPVLSMVWSGDDYCKWTGITCNESDGAVTIDLRLYTILNRFSFSLPELTSDIDGGEVLIKAVDLTGLSVVVGPLPSTWSSLTRVEYVNPGNAAFCGCAPPSWTGNNVLLDALKLLGEEEFNALNSEDCAYSNTCMPEYEKLSTTAFLRLLRQSIPSLESLWNGSNYCTWPGVVCNNPGTLSVTVDASPSSGGVAGSLPELTINIDPTVVQVIELNISNAAGSLPNSWFELQDLVELHLTNGSFCACVPDSWSENAALAAAVDILRNEHNPVTSSDCALINPCPLATSNDSSSSSSSGSAGSSVSSVEGSSEISSFNPKNSSSSVSSTTTHSSGNGTVVSSTSSPEITATNPIASSFHSNGSLTESLEESTSTQTDNRCQVQHCLECRSGSSRLCSTCTEGYSLTALNECKEGGSGIRSLSFSVVLLTTLAAVVFFV